MNTIPLRTGRHRPALRATRMASATLALLLVLSGCGVSEHVTSAHPSPSAGAATATATATTAPLASQPLTWQPTAPLPPAQTPAFVAPSDGDTAYLCAPSTDDLTAPTAPGPRARVWSTRDRGAHWLRQADVPVTVNRNECQIVVDSLDPTIAVVVLDFRHRGSGGGGGGPSTYLNYATEDGGASWRLLPESQPSWMEQLATRNGTAYAIRAVLQSNAITSHLWASTDGMRTWTPLGQQIAADLNTLWLNLASGALLVEAGDPDQPHTLWKSTDGGRDFIQLPLTDSLGFVARIADGATDWTICTVAHDAGALMCSSDGGATWQARSDSTLAPLPVPDFASWTQVLAIADDGSLVAAAYHNADYSTALFWLPAGASPWIALGSTAPYASLAYSTTPGNGMIWQFAGGASTYSTALLP